MPDYKELLEIQEETFQRVALDLHDKVGHALWLAAFHLESLSSVNTQGSKQLDTALSLINSSLHDLRNICKGLNNDHLSSGGFIQALDSELLHLGNTGKFATNFEVTGAVQMLSDFAELMLLRIFQECLTNILRHSQATSINVQLNYDSKAIQLRIVDNGKGFCLNAKLSAGNRTSGLRNIIKRCRLIKASVAMKSSSDGTYITIKLPLDDKK